jgi:hypothetical protein
VSRDKAIEVFAANASHVDDANVRQHAVGSPLVDRRGADPDQLRDLAHGEQLGAARKIWQQIGSKISGIAYDSL